MELNYTNQIAQADADRKLNANADAYRVNFIIYGDVNEKAFCFFFSFCFSAEMQCNLQTATGQCCSLKQWVLWTGWKKTASFIWLMAIGRGINSLNQRGRSNYHDCALWNCCIAADGRYICSLLYPTIQQFSRKHLPMVERNQMNKTPCRRYSVYVCDMMVGSYSTNHRQWLRLRLWKRGANKSDYIAVWLQLMRQNHLHFSVFLSIDCEMLVGQPLF